MSRMTLKMVLFDLDGTLLPMVMDEFTGGYFKMLAKKLNPYGYEHQSLVKAIWHGTAAMVRNDGSCRNETMEAAGTRMLSGRTFRRPMESRL